MTNDFFQILQMNFNLKMLKSVVHTKNDEHNDPDVTAHTDER